MLNPEEVPPMIQAPKRRKENKVKIKPSLAIVVGFSQDK